MPAADYAPPKPTISLELNDIGEAIAFFDKLKRKSADITVFRGHAKSDWDVIPSIFRDELNVLQHESRIVRDLIALYPAEFEHDATMFDRLVRMQHFGLRTRLLDVSRNPLAALYFAVEEGQNDQSDGCVVIMAVPKERVKYYDSDSIAVISNLANLTSDEKEIIEDSPARTIKDLHALHPIDRLYQFIRDEKPGFMPRIKRDDLFKPYFVFPKMNNKRIIAQNGAFVIMGLNRKKGPQFSSGINIERVGIPARAKAGMRESLRKLGFDDSTLFPDIERSAKQIMKNYIL